MLQGCLQESKKKLPFSGQIRKIVASGINSQSSRLFASNITKASLAFVLNLILTQVLGAAQFGLLSLMLSILLTTSAITDFGLAISYVSLHVREAEKGTNLQKYTRAIFSLRIGLSTVCACIALFVMPYIFYNLGVGNINFGFLIVASFFLFFDSIFNFVLAMLQAEKAFNEYGSANALVNIVRMFGIVIISIWFKLSIEITICVYLGSLIIVLGYILRKRPLFRWDRLALIKIGSFSELIRWSRWTFLQTIANVFFVRLDILMLGAFHIDHALIGSYSLAFVFAGILTLFQVTANTLLLPKVNSFRCYAQIEEYAKKMFKVVVGLSPFIVLCGVVITFFLNWIYSTTYPSVWSIFIILYMGFVFSLFATPFVLLAYSIERPDILAYQNVVGLVMVFCLNLFLIPKYGIWGTAISFIFSRAFTEIGAVVVIVRNVKINHLRNPQSKFGY
jgi:O-antigen/teichoic acid export membrane protein